MVPAVVTGTAVVLVLGVLLWKVASDPVAGRGEGQSAADSTATWEVSAGQRTEPTSNNEQLTEPPAAAEPLTGPPPGDGEPLREPVVPHERNPDGHHGAWENPMGWGSAITNGVWEIAFHEPVEVTEEVVAQGFYDPRGDGYELWGVPVAVTNTSSEPRAIGAEAAFAFQRFDGTVESTRCKAYDNEVEELARPVLPGETVDAVVCRVVPAGAPGLWAVTFSGDLWTYVGDL
ncbi:hypothetical protein GCM10023169_37180 [Georgenia halophila]|uniref:DUF4352 domain-containing protein n=2 Tax=Georgenia halophila TaxID=620889 RepID=A0ABP8LLE8_9MICO